MPNIEYFRIKKEAKATLEIPLRVHDTQKTMKWHRNYTVSERKHLLTRLLLHPEDYRQPALAYPVPRIIHARAIRDAAYIENYCFRNAYSRKHYQNNLAICMVRLWIRDFFVNFPMYHADNADDNNTINNNDREIHEE